MWRLRMSASVSANASSPLIDPEWWRGAVLYQVYPRSFQDTTGDGYGDLNGVTKRLTYIASLGVNGIWLSPFFKSPMADMGYDVSDYCDVDPLFGTLADFDALISKAHELGLKVIIDQVISHTSDKHPWFLESRSSRNNSKSDWYIWSDPKADGTPPNNWMSIFGGAAWEWDGVRKQYYMHNFLASQPDLNFHNIEVQDALLETVRFWLERGVDGFRLDTVNFYFHDRELRNNPPLGEGGVFGNDAPDVNPYGMQNHLYDKSQPENLGFLQKLRTLLDQYDARMTVGEVGDGSRSLQTVAAYTSDDDKLNMCYTFDLLGPEFTAQHIRRSVEGFQQAVTDGWVCWAFSNHDVIRHVSRFACDVDELEKIAKLGITLLATLRGSICLYQGEELGLTEADLAYEDLRDPYGIRFWPSFKGRDGCRTPMVWEALTHNAGFTEGNESWLPVPPEHQAKAVDAQEHVPSSILNHYRSTLQFRRSHLVLKAGEMDFLDSNQDLLVFMRSDASERMLFVFNLTREKQEYRFPSYLNVSSTIDIPSFSAQHIDGVVHLEPLSVFAVKLC